MAWLINEKNKIQREEREGSGGVTAGETASACEIVRFVGKQMHIRTLTVELLQVRWTIHIGELFAQSDQRRAQGDAQCQVSRHGPPVAQVRAKQKAEQKQAGCAKKDQCNEITPPVMHELVRPPALSGTPGMQVRVIEPAGNLQIK